MQRNGNENISKLRQCRFEVFFFFFNNSLFLFCGDKLKPKRNLAQRYVNLTGKVAVFRQVSVEPSSSPISLNKKSIVVTGVNLVTEVEQP